MRQRKCRVLWCRLRDLTGFPRYLEGRSKGRGEKKAIMHGRADAGPHLAEGSRVLVRAPLHARAERLCWVVRDPWGTPKPHARQWK